MSLSNLIVSPLVPYLYIMSTATARSRSQCLRDRQALYQMTLHEMTFTGKLCMFTADVPAWCGMQTKLRGSLQKLYLHGFVYLSPWSARVKQILHSLIT